MQALGFRTWLVWSLSTWIVGTRPANRVAPVLLAAAALALAGCVRYQPAPIAPDKTAATLEARSLSDASLKAFLETNLRQPLREWPLRQWDFEQLTLAAFYFHPGLDVARARWSVAKAGEITAGARPNPNASIGPSYNIDAASGVTPWLAFADFDIPIEIAGKRGHRLTQAKQLSQAARLSIVTAAWQVRGNLRAALIDFAKAGRRAELLQAQIALQEKAIQRLEQKLAAGAIASSEILPYRIALQKARFEVSDAERARIEARAKVADALGVPLRALDGVEPPEAMPDLAAAAAQLTSAEARRLALHSRADLLAALAEYEAAQSALQLEIAKQYPDLKLGPGYEYDQGENKFGFRLALELPVFNRNQGPIAEAQARREEAAARFTALQARVLSELDRALTAFQTSEQQARSVDSVLAVQRQQHEKLQQQLAAGAAEPLDLLNAQLELAAGELARHDALMKRQQALAQLEDALQRPLDLPAGLIEQGRAPRRRRGRKLSRSTRLSAKRLCGSAESHSAVSPTCSRQEPGIVPSSRRCGGGAECNSAIQQSETLRYFGCRRASLHCNLSESSRSAKVSRARPSSSSSCSVWLLRGRGRRTSTSTSPAHCGCGSATLRPSCLSVSTERVNFSQSHRL